MHEYDVTLKLLLQASTDSILRHLTGVSVVRWLNAEMPQVQTSRADLLGAAVGRLVHVEFQSTNGPDMALRMAEYAFRIFRQFRKFPKQIVLYVGEPPLRMVAALTDTDIAFRYSLIDIRDLDTKVLLASSHIEDDLLAILTTSPDRIATVREILTESQNSTSQNDRAPLPVF